MQESTPRVLWLLLPHVGCAFALNSSATRKNKICPSIEGIHILVFLTFDVFFTFFMMFLLNKVLAGSAEFRALNTPDKDRPEENKEVLKLYRQLYRVRT